MAKVYAIARVRGSVNVPYYIEDTMRMLRLTRINHVVLVPESASSKGMIQACKDYITWGEASEGAIAQLVEKRGRLVGDKKLTEAFLKEKKLGSFEALAKKLVSGEAKAEDFGIKPVFRLHAPRKGYRHVKRHFPKGALGFRGEKMGELVLRMI